MMLKVLFPLVAIFLAAGCLDGSSKENAPNRPSDPLPPPDDDPEDPPVVTSVRQAHWDSSEFQNAGGVIAVRITAVSENTSVNAGLRHLQSAERNASTCRIVGFTGGLNAMWGRLAESSFGVGAQGQDHHLYAPAIPFNFHFDTGATPVPRNESRILIAGIGSNGGPPLPSGESADLWLNSTEPIQIEVLPAEFVGCVEQPWDLDPEFYAEYGFTGVSRGGRTTFDVRGQAYGWIHLSSPERLSFLLTGPGGALGSADAFTGANFACLLNGAPPGAYDLEVGEAAGDDVEFGVALVSVVTGEPDGSRCPY